MKNKKRVKFSFILSLTITFIMVFFLMGGVGILMLYIFHKTGYNYQATSVITLFFIFVSTSLGLASICAYIINKNMIKEMDTFRNVIASVSKGDFKNHIPLRKHANVFKDTVIDFNKMIDELNSSAILKEDFISNFSHEFKTPIVSIKGYAELLLEDDSISLEDKKKYLKIIIDESKRLSSLSEQTMSLSKLDSKAILEHIEEYDVKTQIEEVVLILDNDLKKKNLEIKILNSPYHTIKGNRYLLQEVWINIISNAIKYSKEFGLIDISFGMKDKNNIISIRDNGKGMDEETKLHIFDRFYQGDKSHSSKGLGLGLAISKRIVLLHHGHIEVESVLGKGSLFNIYLPKE